MIDNCKKRNLKTIDMDYVINEYNLKFSQRLITLKEEQQMTEYEVDIFENEDVFAASLEGSVVFEDVSYKDVDESDKEKFVNILHKLKTARDSVNLAQYTYKAQYIKFSLTNKKVFGGYLKVNDEIITDEDEILEWLEYLDEETFELLFTNAQNLTNPSEEEFIEVEK